MEIVLPVALTSAAMFGLLALWLAVRTARARLKAVSESTDGFDIAEQDLQLRGPGEMLGTRQSGVPTLRVADLIRDHDLMETARREAFAALRDASVATSVLVRLDETWTERFGLASVG